MVGRKSAQLVDLRRIDSMVADMARVRLMVPRDLDEWVTTEAERLGVTRRAIYAQALEAYRSAPVALSLPGGISRMILRTFFGQSAVSLLEQTEAALQVADQCSQEDEETLRVAQEAQARLQAILDRLASSQG